MRISHCMFSLTLQEQVSSNTLASKAQTYLQLPLCQCGDGNVYLLVLSSWKLNIAENPIAVMGL